MLAIIRTASTALVFGLAGAAAAQDEGKAQQPAQPLSAQVAAPSAGVVPPAHPDDVKSLDAVVAALYDVISGDAGKARDWNRFRSLFYPGARMIPTGQSAKTGKVAARIASTEDYIKANAPFLEGEGFHEIELSRHIDSFGNISQVFSSYEARHKPTDEKPFMRGINSIQLLNDGSRWWIMSIAWSPETPQSPLPAQYKQKPER